MVKGQTARREAGRDRYRAEIRLNKEVSGLAVGEIASETQGIMHIIVGHKGQRESHLGGT